MKHLLLAVAATMAAIVSCAPKGGTGTAATTPADSDSILRLNCMIEVTPANRDSVIALSKELVAASLKDSGNLSYDLMLSTTDPSKMMILETWADQKSLDKHSASEHFTRLVPQIQSLAKMDVQVYQMKPDLSQAKDSIIRLNCFVKTGAGQRQAIIKLANALVKASLQDPGNIGYDFMESATDSTQLMFVETWKNQPSLDKHSASAHYTTIVPQIQKLGQMTLQPFKKAVE